jgi:hypothetical protein
LAGTGAEVRDTDAWLPRDGRSPREARLGSDNLGVLTKDIQLKVTEWWLAHASGANTPNWDLAAGASFNGRKGLVLVEAKAHIGELETAGKRLSKTNRDEAGYERSLENHKRIGAAIEQACDALKSHIHGICINRDRHYQVSIRIAFAWKLASLGVPVVLIYLGFLNDTGMRNPFVDENNFRKVMSDYLSAVFPITFLGKAILCGDARMQLIFRCHPILTSSKPLEAMTARLAPAS